MPKPIKMDKHIDVSSHRSSHWKPVSKRQTQRRIKTAVQNFFNTSEISTVVIRMPENHHSPQQASMNDGHSDATSTSVHPQCNIFVRVQHNIQHASLSSLQAHSFTEGEHQYPCYNCAGELNGHPYETSLSGQPHQHNIVLSGQQSSHAGYFSSTQSHCIIDGEQPNSSYPGAQQINGNLEVENLHDCYLPTMDIDGGGSDNDSYVSDAASYASVDCFEDDYEYKESCSSSDEEDTEDTFKRRRQPGLWRQTLHGVT